MVSEGNEACDLLQEASAFWRSFHVSPVQSRLINIPLAQTGEGIKECELISWHVKVPSTPYEHAKEGLFSCKV